MIKRKKKRKNPNSFYQNLAEEIVKVPVTYFSEGKGGILFKFNKNLVIKLLYESTFLDDDCIDHFRYLSNTNLIPKIYEIKYDYIIMDYLKGNSLKSVIMDYELSTKEKKELFKNIEKEISKWHKLYYSHGDLDPGNIIVFNDLSVKFIDPACSDIDNTDEYISKDLLKLEEIENLLL